VRRAAVAALAALAAAPALLTACGGAGAVCDAPYSADVAIRVGGHTIRAEEPGTGAARERGLGGRPCIPDDAAMLFAFRRAGHFSFWMKDMRYPIDIVWLGPDRRVVWVEPRVRPSTYPDTFRNGGEAALYVLELKAGRAAELGLEPGAHVSFG
jgi:uncharacterized membrane protein (UPF0127 family)